MFCERGWVFSCERPAAITLAWLPAAHAPLRKPDGRAVALTGRGLAPATGAAPGQRPVSLAWLLPGAGSASRCPR